MVAIATKAVRDGIITILSNITAVSGTKKVVMKRVRSNVQDYEGYAFRVRLRSSVNSLASADIRNILETWLIEVWTPATGLDNEALKEDEFYDYRDLVLSAFMSNQDLDDMLSVSGSMITSDAIVWQVDESLDGKARSKWTFNLEVQRTEVC